MKTQYPNYDQRYVVQGNLIGPDITKAWALSTAVNTLKRDTVVAPTTVVSEYAVEVVNPSSLTGLNVNLYNIETSLDSFSRGMLVSSFNVPKSTALVIEDCEDAWSDGSGGDVTASAETTDAGLRKVGAGSAKNIVAAGAGVELLAYEDISAVNLSTYKYIRFWLYSSKALAAGDLAIVLDDSSACASPLATISIPAMTATTWYQHTLQLPDPTLLTAVASVGITQLVDVAGFTFYIDDVCVVKGGQDIRFVHGLFVGGTNVRVELDNDTALGAAVDAFTSTIRIREVY